LNCNLAGDVRGGYFDTEERTIIETIQDDLNPKSHSTYQSYGSSCFAKKHTLKLSLSHPAIIGIFLQSFLIRNVFQQVSWLAVQMELVCSNSQQNPFYGHPEEGWS